MTASATAVTDDELLRLRMRSLGLNARGADAADAVPSLQGSSSGSERIAATARRMLAVQGQDWRAAQWALGVRTPGSTIADVRAAYATGLIVRSWPMRGTVHVVAAEDIRWMQRATNARVLAGAPKRREYLGMSDADLDRLVDVSQQALAGGASHDRDSLSSVWTEAGIEWPSNWRYHVIWWLCQNGIAVFGPPGETGEPRLVLARDWIAAPRELDGDDALAELAGRYAAARGPVHAKDLAWWAGLPVRDARRGMELAAEAGRLAPVHRENASGAAAALWAAPEALEKLDALRSAEAASAGAGAGAGFTAETLLLPAFDEHLLGYAERTPQLGAGQLDRIVPGRNGMFLATVVRGGRTVGTWKRGAGKRAALEITAIPAAGTAAAAPPLDPASLAVPVSDWASFHGAEAPPVEIMPVADA
ncbi:DNA glycosylase AlkZ-like family protein [Leucobacter sp. gxy201]|uniref:winged helix DNA-binding domain-containing protein n=1 Tax=Leucobacter sp. gxy201 TaxID=2957200 RepID=UPI003DA0DD65